MIPTRQQILKFAFFVCVFALGMNKITDFDVWYHIKTGEYILTHHVIPHRDIFSYTTKEPWLTHEWLSQVIFELVHKAGGFRLIILFRAMMLCLIFYRVFRMVAQRTSAAANQILIMLLCVIASAGSFLERPQLFSYLLFILLYDLLLKYHEGKKQHVWSCVLLLLLWVNLHSSFMLGLLLILIFAIEEGMKVYLWKHPPDKFRHLSAILIFCAAASLINPNHVNMFLYPFETLFNKQQMELIFEWQSPNFHLYQLQIVELFIFLTAVSMIFSGIKVKKLELFLFFFFLHFALYSMRNLPFFAFVCAALLSEHLEAFTKKITNRLAPVCRTDGTGRQVSFFSRLLTLDKKASIEIPALNAALFLFLLGFALTRIPVSNADTRTINLKDFPSGAVSYLKTHALRGNLFNEYDWGGYLIFNLYPERKVFIDGRADIHVKTTVPDYLKIMHYEKGWEATVKKYDMQIFLLRKNNVLARILREKAHFHVVYEDNVCILLVNNNH